MTPFTVFDSAGRILRSGKCQDDCLDLQAGQGESVLPVESDDLAHYVSGGAVLDRPAMQLVLSVDTVPADGVSEVSLSGVPAGAAVKVLGPVQNSGVADGSAITLTFAIRGDYEILLSLFPYTDSKVTIHAT